MQGLSAACAALLASPFASQQVWQHWRGRSTAPARPEAGFARKPRAAAAMLALGAACAAVAALGSLVTDASGLASAGLVPVEGLQSITTDVTTLRGEILTPTDRCLPQALA